MTDDDKFTMRLSFGCCGVMFLAFACTVFVLAAAIKWVLA